ncbi:MAG: hypothetical protein AB7O66_07060 [Limisphaerales bacterium]
MNNAPSCCSRATLNWIGVAGAFLVMAVLVAALKHYTSTSSVNLTRAAERHKILAEARQKATEEFTTAAWLDQANGIVRLPNSVATALAVKQWQDPAKARADLLARTAKAYPPPPPPAPEPKSEFE